MRMSNELVHHYEIENVHLHLDFITTLVIIISKCRVPHSGKILWIPIIPLIFSIAYAIFYIMKVPLLRVIFGDMTVFVCLFFAAVMEGCI